MLSKIKFLYAGILNTLFGYSAYGILILIGVNYNFALFFSTIAGIIFNYLCFSKIVFNAVDGWKIFLKFIMAYSLIYIVNALLLLIAVARFQLNPFFGQILAVFICILLSWILMTKWVYKK